MNRHSIQKMQIKMHHSFFPSQWQKSLWLPVYGKRHHTAARNTNCYVLFGGQFDNLKSKFKMSVTTDLEMSLLERYTHMHTTGMYMDIHCYVVYGSKSLEIS